MLKKVIKIQIVDNFVAWYYRFARERARERWLSPSLIFNLFFGGFSSVMRWFGSLKDDFYYTLKHFFFTRGGPFVESSVCVCLCSCLFFFLWIGITTIQRMSLSNARSRANCSSLTHSLSHARVHSSLQRWYYVHFVSSFKNQSFFFLRKLFFLRLRVGFAICKI